MGRFHVGQVRKTPGLRDIISWARHRAAGVDGWRRLAALEPHRQEIFYATPDSILTVIPVNGQASRFDVGTGRPLFPSIHVYHG